MKNKWRSGKHIPPNRQIMAEKQRVENCSEEHRDGTKHGGVGGTALRDYPRNHHKLGSSIEYRLQPKYTKKKNSMICELQKLIDSRQKK